ncbi:MAG TPA: hypothetical protein VFH11_05550 [Gemmatimonadota bacterium]|nr:hypothetical protein [Gemmatimonadota bacterium]
MRGHILLPCALLAALAFASSCSEELPPPEPAGPTIEERTFTRALSDLIVARIQLLPDTAAYARRAEEILREHGVSEKELRTFVEVHGQNDDLMTRAYGRVSARLDTLFPIVQPGAEVPATADTATP